MPREDHWASRVHEEARREKSREREELLRRQPARRERNPEWEWAWVSTLDSGRKAHIVHMGRWWARIQILENNRKTVKRMRRSQFYEEFEQAPSK